MAGIDKKLPTFVTLLADHMVLLETPVTDLQICLYQGAVVIICSVQAYQQLFKVERVKGYLHIEAEGIGFYKFLHGRLEYQVFSLVHENSVKEYLFALKRDNYNPEKSNP